MTNWNVSPRQRSTQRPTGHLVTPSPLDVLAPKGQARTATRTLALPRWLSASSTLDVLSSD